MYGVQLWFRFQPRELQENSGDEGELQIAAINVSGGVGHVTITTVNLFAQNYLDERGYTGPGSEFSPISLGQVSAESPFVGYAIRAIERDNSTNRQRDLNTFENRIQEAVDSSLATESLPDVNSVWTSANSAGLTDRRWRDDDDKIGVSARVYPEFGGEVDRIAGALPAAWPRTPGSRIPRTSSQTGLLFKGDGAEYFVEAHLEATWA